MINKTTTSKFNVGDIVTIARDYKEFAQLDIAQPQIQVYSVMSVNADCTITLAGVFSDIPAEYVVGVPIEGELSMQIYYAPELQARHYVLGKVKQQEDIYSRPQFMTTLSERYGAWGLIAHPLSEHAGSSSRERLPPTWTSTPDNRRNCCPRSFSD